MPFIPSSMTAVSTIPAAVPAHIQKEQICFARSKRPSPSAREMAEVPPMPNSEPSAMNTRNTGIAMDTAASW